ncbi:MAG: hypothetical protein ACTS73_08280 [Arsenophonus sp. NEOnobi-MAG3]
MILIHALKKLITLYPAHIVTINMLSGWILIKITAISLQISDCRKIFNNLAGTSIEKLDHKDKWFSYLRSILNRLSLLESEKSN